MGYSQNAHDVRVDFFKPSGKWYETESVSFEGLQWRGQDKEGNILQGVDSLRTVCKKALRRHLEGRMKGMMAVILEPYHEFAHPVMIKDWEEEE